MSAYEREQSLKELPSGKRGYDRIPNGHYDAQSGFTTEQLDISNSEKNGVIEKVGLGLAQDRDTQRNNPLFDDIQEASDDSLTWILSPTITFARVYEKNPDQPGHTAYMAAERISEQSGLFGYCAALAPDTESRAKLFEIMAGALAESVVAMSPRQLESALKLVFFHPNTNGEHFHSAHIIELVHGNVEPFLGFSRLKEHLVVPQSEFLAQIITKWQTEANTISQKIKQGETITIQDLKWLELFSNITEMDVVVAEIKDALSHTVQNKPAQVDNVEADASAKTQESEFNIDNPSLDKYLKILEFLVSDDGRDFIPNKYMQKIKTSLEEVVQQLIQEKDKTDRKNKFTALMGGTLELVTISPPSIFKIRDVDTKNTDARNQLINMLTAFGFKNIGTQIDKNIYDEFLGFPKDKVRNNNNTGYKELYDTITNEEMGLQINILGNKPLYGGGYRVGMDIWFTADTQTFTSEQADLIITKMNIILSKMAN